MSDFGDVFTMMSYVPGSRPNGVGTIVHKHQDLSTQRELREKAERLEGIGDGVADDTKAVKEYLVKQQIKYGTAPSKPDAEAKIYIRSTPWIANESAVKDTYLMCSSTDALLRRKDKELREKAEIIKGLEMDINVLEHRVVQLEEKLRAFSGKPSPAAKNLLIDTPMSRFRL